MEAIELGFDTLVRLCILLIELAGIIVIVISMVRGFIGFVQKDDSTRIQLAQGGPQNFQLPRSTMMLDREREALRVRDRQRLE